ncbi:MAG: methyltransferase domain-containing protein [Patescibacteria group bacterium]
MKTLKLIARIVRNTKKSVLRKYHYLYRRLISPKLPKNADGKVYVNLGAGINTSEEYINVDAIYLPHIHHIANIQDLGMLPNNSVDLLYASHVVEHLPRKNLKKTLLEWKRVLKPGGILRFGVPNFDALVEVYTLSGKNTESIVNQLLGQDGEYDDHHTIWNEAYARSLLKELGYKDVSLWDYTKVEHRDFDDKASRVMKAGGKDILISLNIQAVK